MKNRIDAEQEGEGWRHYHDYAERLDRVFQRGRRVFLVRYWYATGELEATKPGQLASQGFLNVFREE